MKQQFNYIIVGQGLAGTILAHALLKQGRSVLLIDDGKLSSASKVAAGLYNPIVFKRLVKSWLADELLPVMDEFYPELETLLETRFYFKKQILKPFSEEQEKILWEKKTKEEIGKYLNREVYYGDLNGVLNNPLGASEVLHTGNLDTQLFLGSSGNYFKKNNILLDEVFDYDLLQISENTVSYKEYEADKIIFCEGHKATENPFFSWLPFKLTKGEIIIIELNEEATIPENVVVNKAVFILPLGDRKYKVGATYEWADLTENTTEKGKAELIDKLQKVLKVPFQVIEQQAGIRPTVNDRRPLIGLHPELNVLGVFNGMGTKGVMLAPFFAKQFAAYLDNKGLLDKEVDIARFNSDCQR